MNIPTENHIIQFASHGVDILSSLQEDYQNLPELESLFNSIFATFEETTLYLNVDEQCLPKGILFKQWITRELEMDEIDRSLSFNNLIMVLVYHLVTMNKLIKKGVDLDKWKSISQSTVGHSVGLVSAVLFSLNDSKDTTQKVAKSVLRYITCLCYRCREFYVKAPGNAAKDGCNMAAIRGLFISDLSNRIMEFNKACSDKGDRVYLGLINTDDMLVVVANRDSLGNFKDHLLKDSLIKDEDWSPLEASEPYHSVHLEEVSRIFQKDREFSGFCYTGSDLNCPVLSCKDGINLQNEEDLYTVISRLMCSEILNWQSTIGEAVNEESALIVDMGPGPLTKLFTQVYLRSNNLNLRQISIDRENLISSLPKKIQPYKATQNQTVSEWRSSMNAIVFAGQGIQKIGMGAGLFDKYKEETDLASEALGVDIADLCLKDPQSVLNQTEYTQPAIYLVNALKTNELFEQIDRNSIAYAAGHSLGEYNALYAAGAFSLIDGFKLVVKRGQLMKRAKPGAMASVMGMEVEKIEDLLMAFGFDCIFIANTNTPEQTVISGEPSQVEEIGPLLSAAGAVNVIPLKTSGAFHSPYVLDAANEFADTVLNFKFESLHFKVLSNLTARPHIEEEIADKLVKQIYSQVKWNESMNYLLDNGVLNIKEVGESEILGRMLKVTMKYREECSLKKSA